MGHPTPDSICSLLCLYFFVYTSITTGLHYTINCSTNNYTLTQIGRSFSLIVSCQPLPVSCGFFRTILCCHAVYIGLHESNRPGMKLYVRLDV